jgi:hypothetical protein
MVCWFFSQLLKCVMLIEVVRFSLLLLFKWWYYFGFLDCVVIKCSDISEEHSASILKVTELVKWNALPCRYWHNILINIRTYHYYMVQKSKRLPSSEGYANVSIKMFLCCIFVSIMPEKHFRWFQSLYSKCSTFLKF